ncbi:MAG: SDR family NAD(P)-dependent oxidoreductase [Alphaproteobacteria bacterium]|nr:SDR family NAD(P)-dependent oxidoreductase [Alphaproteobacteria bacterium]
MTVFITGASSGFGAATARRFARDGHQVILAARRTDRIEQLAQELGNLALPVTMDVTDTPAIAPIIANLPKQFADIDVLVNNAGLALGLSSAQEADFSDWQRMIETNCLGLVAVTRAVLPQMVARKSGHVINIGSVAGTYPYAGGNVYGATKAFVHQFSLNLRSDLSGTNVRVTDISPGLTTGSEFSQVRYKGDEAQAAKTYQGAEPMTSENIAEAIWWVTSLPPNVNINCIEMMATCQSLNGFNIYRK